jgi:hypothetical protein
MSPGVHFTETTPLPAENRDEAGLGAGSADMLFDGKQRLLYLIPVGFVGLAVALTQTGDGHISTHAPNGANAAAALRAAPCGQAVQFQLGSVDQRFGLTSPDALASIRQAVGFWNSAADDTVIEYNGDRGIPVNFVYDDRERMAQDHAAYAATINQYANEQRQIDNETASVRENLNGTRASFSSEERAFKTKQEMHNTEVERLNSGGGGTDEQVKAFDEDKRQLEQQLDRLKGEEAAINGMVDQENALIAQHNALVNRANAVINIVNQDVGKDYVAGLYTMKNGRAQIDIFAFADRSDLIRLLAHEFGHALGLGHIDNPNSVMAASRETGMVSLDTAGEMQELNSQDLSALRAVCGKM